MAGETLMVIMASGNRAESQAKARGYCSSWCSSTYGGSIETVTFFLRA